MRCLQSRSTRETNNTIGHSIITSRTTIPPASLGSLLTTAFPIGHQWEVNMALLLSTWKEPKPSVPCGIAQCDILRRLVSHWIALRRSNHVHSHDTAMRQNCIVRQYNAILHCISSHIHVYEKLHRRVRRIRPYAHTVSAHRRADGPPFSARRGVYPSPDTNSLRHSPLAEGCGASGTKPHTTVSLPLQLILSTRSEPPTGTDSPHLMDIQCTHHLCTSHLLDYLHFFSCTTRTAVTLRGKLDIFPFCTFYWTVFLHCSSPCTNST